MYSETKQKRSSKCEKKHYYLNLMKRNRNFIGRKPIKNNNENELI